MKIISWNVNGLRAVHRKGLFLPFIEEYKPDILCLQEIKSRKEQNELDLKDYLEYWNPAERPGYSGTAIFVRKPARTTVQSGGEKPLSIIYGFPPEILEKYKLNEDGYGDPNTEGRVLTAEFKDFFVVTVYTPNSKADLTRLPLRHKQWDPAFLEYLNKLKKEKNVIFCGDLNVAHTEDDLTNPKQNEGEHGFTKEEREGIDNVIENGFVDTFREFTKGKGFYTWWAPFANARARNIGWRLDYFFANKEFLPNIKSSKILKDVLGSDHCPILLELI
ncbi:MAG: exodeoxyribonuclease III [Patescibacteria group bacterium]